MSGRRYTDADRAKARELRDRGMTYAQIQRRIPGVTKGALAYWLNPASRERCLQRTANVRHFGHSGSDRYSPEAVADRRLREELRRAPCSYCGGPGGTIDHVIPLASGGRDDASNIVAACLRCNSSKAHIPVESWANGCTRVRSEFARSDTGDAPSAA